MSTFGAFSRRVPMRSTAGLSDVEKEAVNKYRGQGLNCSAMTEAQPIYKQAEGEHVIRGENQAYIVLGRDRPSNKASGYGGQGGDKCGMIDLCVGRLSSAEAGQNSNMYVDPSFSADAARIYISQKTDIDDNFGLDEGSVGLSKARSAIGMKADSIRIISRQGIKLVTSMDEPISTLQGQSVQRGRYGIDLLAGNFGGAETAKDKNGRQILQPLARGDYLEECLRKIIGLIQDTNKVTASWMKQQAKWNIHVAAHYHEGPFPAAPSPSLAAQLIPITSRQTINCIIPAAFKNRVNIDMVALTYLNGESSNSWINSRWNRTT